MEKMSELLIGKKNISKRQFLSNPQLLRQFGFWNDTDKDNFLNFADCYPFDPKRHQDTQVQKDVSILKKREAIKQEAKERGRPFTRTELQRRLGGGAGISALRQATAREKARFEAGETTIREAILEPEKQQSKMLSAKQRGLGIAPRQPGTEIFRKGYYDITTGTYISPTGEKKSMRPEDIPEGTIKTFYDPSQDFFFKQNAKIKRTPTAKPPISSAQKPITAEDLKAISSATKKTTKANQIKSPRIDYNKPIDVKKSYGSLGLIRGKVESVFDFFGKGMKSFDKIESGTEIKFTETGEKAIKPKTREPINIFDIASKQASSFITFPLLAGERALSLVKEPSARKQIFPSPIKKEVQFEEVRDAEGKLLYTRPIPPLTPIERTKYLAEIGLGLYTGYQYGKFGAGQIEKFKLKQLEKTQPTITGGYQITGAEDDFVSLVSRKTSPLAKQETLTKFKVAPTGDKTYQITGGEGIVRTTTKQLLRKPKVTTQEFTFFGKAQEPTAKLIRKKGIITATDDITQVKPVTSQVQLLTRAEQPKLYKGEFFGFGAKEQDINVILGGRLKDIGGKKTFDYESFGMIKQLKLPKETGTSNIIFSPGKKSSDLFLKQLYKTDTSGVAGITGIGVEKTALKTIPTPKVSPVGLIAPLVKPTTDIRPKTTLKQVPLIRDISKEKSLTMLGFGLISPTKTKEKTTSILSSELLSNMGAKEGITPVVTFAQIQPQVQQQKPITMPVTTPQIPSFILPPELPKMSLPIGFPDRKKTKFLKEQPYNAYAFIDSTKKKKAHYRQLNKQPLTKKSALGMAFQYVDKNISARGKISPTKPIIQKGKKIIPKAKSTSHRTYVDTLGYKFRTFSGLMQRPLPQGHFIERQPYRLDSPRERKQIGKAKRNSYNRKFSFNRLFGL